MSIVAEFREEVEAFLADANVEATAFGRDALKDGNFVSDLRTGRSPTLRTIERVRDYIKSERERLSAKADAA